MENKTYSAVAKIYAHLMRKVDYNDWAEYLKQLSAYARYKITNVLEIAAGTCPIACVLKNEFPNLIATDLSKNMLLQCNDDSLKRVVADMRRLPFKTKFDFIYSTFDSVNYLLSEEDVEKFLSEVSELMHEKSILTFDVSLEKNSLKYERKLNRRGKVNGIKYIQKSNYDRVKKIHENRFIIKDQDGNTFEEVHRQRIYDLIDFFEFIENSGMFVVECFEAFTFDDADQNTDRAQFVIKKGVEC